MIQPTRGEGGRSDCRGPGLARRALAALLLALLLSGCNEGMLAPQSPQAGVVSQLWWIMLGISSGVFLLVLAILAGALLRSWRRPEPLLEPRVARFFFVIGGGFVLPIVVLGVLSFLTIAASVDITQGQGGGGQQSQAVKIEVIGHQWWWEVRYPDAGVITANEIHIPVGQPVDSILRSEDVIHSFWVPQLAGKTDLVPGRTNRHRLQADEAGTYQGHCAEFCGLQHARMLFQVIAQPPDQFQQWLAQQQQPAPQPTTEMIRRGQQVFLGSACVYCHTVEGTNATGTLGPDLTHVASRRTLAAGSIPNNRGNLSGWVLDPQAVKPGTQMPGTLLTPEELDALVTYLMSLQ